MFNQLTLIGNLTKEWEIKNLPNGSTIAKSSIATSHKYKAQDGTQKEEVCFLDFNVFGKGAEILNQYCSKGSKVMLEGRLILESWTAQDGTARQRHSLRVEEFKFLDTKKDNGEANTPQSYQRPQQKQQEEMPEIDYDIDDSLPF
jgi:single-strand DNA-binding protein